MGKSKARPSLGLGWAVQLKVFLYWDLTLSFGNRDSRRFEIFMKNAEISQNYTTNCRYTKIIASVK